MMVETIFFFTVVVAAVTAAPQGRIVGGEEAELGEFPYVASLQKNGKHFCGCSIISSRYLLTAAHCVEYENNENMRILYGVVNINVSSENIVALKRIIMKEDYAPEYGYINDIALLEVIEDIQFGSNVQPVQLPESYDYPGDFANATLVGWGRTGTNESLSPLLLKVNIILFTHSYCQSKEPSYSPENHVCAGLPEGGYGQCNGDSGGPLTVNGVQYGVVSWSVKPCASVEHPGVFSSVAAYREWIREHSGV